MLGHLSNRTRHFVEQLANAEDVTLGGKAITPFSGPQREFLKLVSLHLRRLADKKGGDLVAEVLRLSTSVPELIVTGVVVDSKAPTKSARKLGRIRARSFRGIAPAGHVWEHDFDSKSHLFYGPNGCGKSSLFGAICWCLTGRLFRDDGPPSHPEMIQCYGGGKKPKAEGTRPDALTLTHVDGSLSASHEHYSVSLELVSSKDGTDRIWIQRHSQNGLASSPDGATWSPITSLSEVRLSDLDVELHILVPAKVGHLRFGKNSEALTIFSQLIGLDDLEQIAEVAGKCHTGLVKEANALEKQDLKELQQLIGAIVLRIDANAPQHIKDLAAYPPAVSTLRTVAAILALRTVIDDRLSGLASQLASDLGIVLSKSDDSEAPSNARQLDLLPGHIDSATSALGLPPAQLFPSSVGLPVRTADGIQTDRDDLGQFIQTTKKTIAERLNWALQEQQSTKAGLLLLAAEHFPPGSRACPVCAQDMAGAPAVAEQLTLLQPLVGQPHLKQSLEDLSRSLLANLDGIVSSQRRTAADKGLGARLLQDWQSLKASRFLGLITTIAERFDAAISGLAASMASTPNEPVQLLAETHPEQYGSTFNEVEKAIQKAAIALALDDDRVTHDERMKSLINDVLCTGDNSLASVLQRGRNTHQQIKEFTSVRTDLDGLHQNQTKVDSLTARINALKDLADASSATKDLGDHVRDETINVVKAVEPIMKAYYERLYDNEYLALDLVTPGHAANPSVKDEFNVYLRAGDSRLPAGPYSNAGRLRALALCFAFALRTRSERSLDIVLLDDPALSLDDEHKARFLDHAVVPCLANDQVLLATHYEDFYKSAELRFATAERLHLVPRRSVEDAIAFEPTDLLQRVGEALTKRTTAWREMGINLRRWGERALATLSGHCPLPFVVFNNIPGSIDAYAAIKDTRVVSDRRSKIVAALRSPQFATVVHKLAHDEEVLEVDVKDAHAVLSKCRKEAEAEIERFREIHKHEVQKRGISARPPLGVLDIAGRSPAKDLPVSGRAAAASNGVGITWLDPEIIALPEYPIVVVKSDVIEPIALVGQYLILDQDDSAPSEGDLVAVRDQDSHSYTRRFWRHDGLVNLEATNPTSPVSPVVLPADHCFVRRVVGVLYEGAAASAGGVGNEWYEPTSMRATHLNGLEGVRVDGTSLEPVARNGQVVLLRKVNELADIGNGQLACIETEDIGVVLKRCYVFGTQLVLCPVNPVDVEEPIIVDTSAVLHAHKFVGVLFEPIESDDSRRGD